MIEPFKKIVLIVDSDPTVLNELKMRLSEKYELMLLERGEETLQAVSQKNEFNLIILDYRLSDQDGVSLFKKIRQENRVTPIIFTCAHPTKEVLIQMLAVRPHGFIEKPYNMDLLDQKVARLVGANPFEPVHQMLNIPIHSLSIKIFRAMQFIDRHHSSSGLSLEGVGEAVSLHPKYLSASFKEECGIGFHDYLIEIRIYRATQLLKDPRRIIKQVSSEVGFSDQGYFCKVFQNKIGLSPSIYRKEFLAKKR